MMQEGKYSTSIIDPSTITTVASRPTSDYSEILDLYGMKHAVVDYHLQVGDIKQTQGWILHLSAVISQVESLIHRVAPILYSENVPFKIIMEKETCSDLLNGAFGKAKIGKVISIYPANEIIALDLAQKLLHITKDFKGPKILTDICLGNIVYTRFGGFNPVKLTNKTGKEENFIYGYNGELVRDEYNMPFKLPEGISWPFAELASPVPTAPKKILNKIYKPLSTLKSDVRGNVYKGIYLKNLFNLGSCVIKQGNKNMASEDSGRAMHDRLVWQMELHSKLIDEIPIPKIFDLFQEDEDTYLVMEFVKGQSLIDQRSALDPGYNAWRHLSPRIALKLLSYLIDITEIIEKFHKNGYVHRDIAPGNFLIDKNDNIHLIDIELSYSLREKRPDIPFQLGTPGFMSPEQLLVQEPTVKEDVFGLGALMLCLCSCVSPVRISIRYPDILTRNIDFFIDNKEMAQLISSCLEIDPSLRPTIQEIKKQLIEYKAEMQDRLASKVQSQQAVLDMSELRNTIGIAINGLVKSPVVSSNDFWYSKLEKNEDFERGLNKEYTRYIGLCEGTSGVLYMLARAKAAGFDINACLNRYYRGWEYMQEAYFDHMEEGPAGLYDGGAGVALALAEGIKAGLIDNTDVNRAKILNSLKVPVKDLDLAQGLAGQGVVILRCEELLGAENSQFLLKRIAETLVAAQKKDGSWLVESADPGKESHENISMGFGIGGIIWLLLSYGSRHNDMQAYHAAEKGLKWILNKTNDLKSLFQSRAFKKLIGENNSIGDERRGLILTFMKAYEKSGVQKYMRVAEEALMQYPSYLIKNDFSQKAGMAAMGEMYLEAWRVFKTEEWRRRAEWIANVYLHTLNIKKSDNSGYWRMDENEDPTADFMVGNSGIIHFLMRMAEPEKIGYRILE